jgi:hypothetical protein
VRDVSEPRDFQGSSSETDSRDRHRMETIPKTLCLELARVTEVEAGLRALLEKYGTSPLDGDISSQLLPLVRSCWRDHPEGRPSFSQICSQLEALLEPEKRTRKRYQGTDNSQ